MSSGLKPVYLEDMCRVCMMTSEFLKDVVSYELTPKICAMLNSCAEINVNINDCLPSLICASCYKLLISSYNFKHLCEESNNILQNYVFKMQNETIDLSQENRPVPSQLCVSLGQEKNYIKNEVDDNCSVKSTNTIPPTPERLEQGRKSTRTTKSMERKTDKQIENIPPLSSLDILTAVGLVRVNNNNDNNSQDNSDCCLESNPLLVSPKKIKVDECRNFICNKCDASFTNESDLKKHRVNHSKNARSCKICGLIFDRHSLVKLHIEKVHSGSMPYKCVECDSKFKTLDSWTVHMRQHAGKPAYTCKICKKGFRLSRDYKKHQSVHISKDKVVHKPEANYKCRNCEKSFRKRCDLERHERVHSGAKPYKCEICGGSFQQTHNLTKHMVKHTNDKLYKCDICQKAFGRSDVLARHLLVHTVKKPHACADCNKTFARKSQLEQHRENNGCAAIKKC